MSKHFYHRTPTISTGMTLPAATVGTAYTTPLAGAGGVTPYVWAVVSATPNTGTQIPIGNLTGANLAFTPGTAEVETIVVSITDALGNTRQKTFSLTIQAAAVPSAAYKDPTGIFITSENVYGQGHSDAPMWAALKTGSATSAVIDGGVPNHYPWSVLETAQGVYNFAQIAADCAAAWAQNPNLRIGLHIQADINSGKPFAQLPSIIPNCVPSYISHAPGGVLTVNGVTYTMAEQIGGGYGYGYSASTGTSYIVCTALLCDPCVNACWINFWTALASAPIVGPDGHTYTFSTCPWIRWLLCYNEISYAFNTPIPGQSGVNSGIPQSTGSSNACTLANWWGNHKAWALAVTAAFPTTVLYDNMTYGIIDATGAQDGPTGFNTVNGHLADSALGGIVGWGLATSDTWGSDWSSNVANNVGAQAQNSIQAMIGIQTATGESATATLPTPTNPDKRGRWPNMAHVDSIDFGKRMYQTASHPASFFYYTQAGVLQILNSMNGTSPPESATFNRRANTWVIAYDDDKFLGTAYVNYIYPAIAAAVASGLGPNRTLPTSLTNVGFLSPAILPGGANGGIYLEQLQASGGTAPFTYTLNSNSGATLVKLTAEGWLIAAPKVNETCSLSITVTDAGGHQATKTFTVTFGPGLQTTNFAKLPNGYQNTPYAFSFGNVMGALVAGGTGPYTIGITGLPTGLSADSLGNITGVPSSTGTTTGITITATDTSNGATDSTTVSMTVVAAATASRPSGNTGSGFYANGNKVYDPTGNLFIPRGSVRKNWNSSVLAGNAPATAMRVLIDPTQPAANNVALLQSIHIDNNQVPVPVIGNTLGSTASATLTAAVSAWTAQEATWAPIQSSMILGIANGWGAANSSAWESAYVSAIGSLRSAGYTCPLLIDSGSSGEDLANLTSFATTVAAADPQKNVIFGFHLYSNVSAANLASTLATLAGLSVPVWIVEFGPSGLSGDSTQVDASTVIGACESNGLGWFAYAWDDGPATGTDSGDTMTLNGPGTYNVPSDLTRWGLEIGYHPSYGQLSVGRQLPPIARQVFNFANFSGASGVIRAAWEAAYVDGGQNIALTPAAIHKAGTAWYENLVDITTFTWNCTLLSQVGNANTSSAQGIGLVIQNSNSTTNPSTVSTGFGTNAIGDANMMGFGAYAFQTGQAIGNSVAIKLDMSGANGQNTFPTGVVPNSTGLYVNGGPSGGLVPEIDLNPKGFNLHLGNPLAVQLVYDTANNLTMVIKDQTTGKQFRQTWNVNIPQIVKGNTAIIGFSGGTVVAAEQKVTSWGYATGYNPRLTQPAFSVTPGQYASTQTVSITGPSGAAIYYTTDGTEPTSADNLYSTSLSVTASTILKAVAIQANFTDSLVTTGYYQIASGGTPNINFPSGFASASGLMKLTGSAVLSGSAIELVQAAQQAGATWFGVPVGSNTFDAKGQLQFSSGAGGGMALVLQNAPVSDTGIVQANGGPGLIGVNANEQASMGYAGITNGSGGVLSGILQSIAFKFDAGSNTLGCYTGGAAPTTPQTTIGGSVSLSSGNPIDWEVNVSSGTATVTVTDHNTPAHTFQTTFPVNMAAALGGSTAYLGITAATGFGAGTASLNTLTC